MTAAIGGGLQTLTLSFPAAQVRDHPKLGVQVEGLTRLAVHSPAQIAAALERGAALRAVAETAMNAESSRSKLPQVQAGQSRRTLGTSRTERLAAERGGPG